MLIFDAIERIEVALRTQIIHQYAIVHGSHWQLDSNLFVNLDRYNVHKESLNKEIKRSQEVFIKHYYAKYHYPEEPACWMSLEITSLGLLSKLFQNLKKSKEKIAVTSHFGLNDFKILENWMLCFSILRNTCAHHGRIWNRRLNKIKLPKNPKYHFLENNNIYTNKIYATLSCMTYIIRVINPESQFKNRLITLIDSCPLAQTKEMGFPENWVKEDLWK